MAHAPAPRLMAGQDSKCGLVQLLVSHATAGVSCSDATRQAYQGRLLSYALRLLASNLAVSAHPGDAASVVQAIKQRLYQQQRDGDAASVEDLYLKLAGTQVLSWHAQSGALQLLLQLAGGGESDALHSIAAYRPLQVPKPVGVPAHISGGLDQGRSWQDGAASSTAPTPRGQDGFMGLAEQAPSSRSSPCPAAAASSHQGLAVCEASLVKDLLRAATALPGSYTRYEHLGSMAAGQFVVAGGGDAAMSRGQRQIMHSLGELGLLFSVVRSHISSGRNGGSVRQAFSAALQQEVADLYQLLALLERQLAHKPPAPGREASDGPYLTLRRLHLWLAEPLRRMRLLAVLADSTSQYSGGALAGVLWAHAEAGDPLSRAYVTRLLHQVCVPLFDKIRVWVFEGRLEDPDWEFFIVRQAAAEEAGRQGGSASGGDPWHGAYKIEAAKLPPFLPQALAERILRAGKSINFMRDSCGDARWVAERAAANQEAAAAVAYGQLDALEAAVGEASAVVDQRLLHLLTSRFHLSRHCDAIRRYLLLGQGDFVVALIDALDGELSKRARDVSEVALNHLLRQAVLASAAKRDEEDTLQRLRARHDAAAGGLESGWDVFSLRYEVGGPLSAVFTPAAMAQYQQVFKLLWRLQRVQHGLDRSWSMLKVEVERELRKFRPATRAAVNALLRRCLTLRHEMSVLATFMQRYVTFGVLEGEWQTFCQRMATASDLDALLCAHTAYLDAVTSKALLGGDEPSTAVRDALGAVLGQALRLPPLVARLKEAVKSAVAWLEGEATRAARNTAAGGWGTTSGGAAARKDEEVALEELEALGATLAQLEAAHGGAMAAFRQQLAGAGGHQELRFLLIPLDASFAHSQHWRAAAEDAAE